MHYLRSAVGIAPLLVSVCVSSPSFAETFVFGSNANALLGAPGKTLTVGSFSMHLAAGPTGAGLWEAGTNVGMGVDASSVLGPGGLAARFDRIQGVSEYIEFSFDSPGVLTGLNFDGVKDESLEYFTLTSTNDVRVNLFDSAANTTIPGAVDNAFQVGAITGQVVYLLEGNGFDDEIHDLAVSFAAGQVFRLTYSEVGGGLGTPFEPTLAPNGARLQSITVTPVPEPAFGAAFCVVVGMLLNSVRCRRGSTNPLGRPDTVALASSM